MPLGPRISAPPIPARRGYLLAAMWLGALALAMLAGCNLVLPETTQQPVVHNPFPQLSRVAVAPFFNQSDEPTVNGREFALAYFAELQETPGFLVAPVGVVENAIRAMKIDLSDADDRRRLCKALGVDALVIGAVTDFSPYYPPRCGMRVDWYAANEGFHEAPAGYGLPWGTPQEEFIPDSLVFEAEMAVARAQLATQSPESEIMTGPGDAPIEPLRPMREPAPLQAPSDGTESQMRDGAAGEELPPPAGESMEPAAESVDASDVEAIAAAFDEPLGPSEYEPAPLAPGAGAPGDASDGAVAIGPLPADWPDARGLTPPGPSPTRPRAERFDGPVLTHTRIFRSTDSNFTAALEGYVGFRDDARFGGWQSYLDRSEDFIRFCCHLHVVEMLSARGGADQTRVVRRWAESR